SNISWNISDDVPWLTMAPESGTGNGSVVASYSANLTSNSRVATITLTGAGVPDKIIRLTQEAFSAFLLVNPQNHDVGEQAGSVTFDLNANVAWTVNVDVPWVSVNPNFGSGNFTLTASYQANPNPVIRVATITITSGLTGPVTVTITQSASTATSELEAAYKFALFPNPAKEALNLSMDLPNADLVRLEILTLDGKRIALLSDDVLPSGKQNFNYDVSTLASGVYLVKMQVEEGMIVRRFVVQR
ncbi:MAG TPA: BACON domain-containing carbohydrate-binding protein, partial [Saprospiraceae bacterium]|nr:BACON domain-containing carbohydrate-binding protein [Saprospiraceae bacterium]